MTERSYKITVALGTALCLMALFIIPVSAKKHPSERRETAITRLISLEERKNSSAFDRYLKRVIRLYSHHIQHLQASIIDQESALLLEEAESFHRLIQTGSLSHDATIEKLKHEHELMKLIELKLTTVESHDQDVDANQVVTMSTGNDLVLTGSADHAPTKKMRQAPDLEDLYNISISVPMDVGRRHGFDMLNKDE